MKLAPSLWEVNFSRAFYLFYFERRWRDAEPHFAKAITINPRSSLAQAYFGLFLTTIGRAEDAVTHTTLACQLDPLSQIIHGLTASTLSTLGRFDQAEHLARRALELQPDYLFGLWCHGLALCGLGRNEEGVASLERAVFLSRAPIFVGIMGFGYAWAGRSEDATRLLHELEDRGSRGEYIPAFSRLAIYVGLGDLAGIRRALSRAIAEADAPLTVRVICGRFLEKFRYDPEIDRLHLELFGW
jgi:tetratricopeptide (TPR) repeat protein